MSKSSWADKTISRSSTHLYGFRVNALTRTVALTSELPTIRPQRSHSLPTTPFLVCDWKLMWGKSDSLIETYSAYAGQSSERGKRLWGLL